MNDNDDIIISYKQIAFICMLDGNDEAALEIYQQMEELCLKSGNTLLAGETAFVIGLLNSKLEKQQFALNAFERASRIAVEIKDLNFEAHSVSKQLSIYLKMKKNSQPFDIGKALALQARLQAIPEDKIKDQYQPPWLNGG